MYEIFNLGAKLVPKLPCWVRKLLPGVVGSLAWMLARRKRENVTANISQVLGPPIGHFLSRVRENLIVRRIFCNGIRNYLDLLALPATTRLEVIARLDMTGVEYLEEALSYGRGVVLFSAHLGAFEYASSWFGTQGYEVVIPVEQVRDERMMQLMLALRRRNGVDFVSLNGFKAARAMFNALQRNQIVLIAADRAIKGKCVVTDFFGAAARLPRGPVDLSVRTGAPLVGAFPWRSSEGRVTCEFTRLTLALPESQRDNAQVLQVALTRQLEKVISDHLDQWVVFEPIWANSGLPGRSKASSHPQTLG